MRLRIKNIYVGSEKTFKKRDTSFKSSYEKQKINDDIFVTTLGLKADTQSDKISHGGKDRALCVYTQGAYNFFKDKYKLDLKECAFGENIILENCDDSDICLGDIFTCSNAVLEVCQPRLPCWKISFISEIKNLTSIVVKEGKTGFQLRVLKEGEISKNDKFILQERKYPNISIEFINKCFYNAKENQENIRNILKIEVLASAYKKTLEKRYLNKSIGITKYQEDKV
ncbi:MOSC domain-containing protein [Poseidonibacter antarcticus]|uniref:MOSC domain-containing protein n=1 Tax=Poseidonibacter antarcticus TaxID=2478538 RepID=UPI000EF528E1|nr:MOSC domain-containing protein [Poseidonibacter antarcticus]